MIFDTTGIQLKRFQFQKLQVFNSIENSFYLVSFSVIFLQWLIVFIRLLVFAVVIVGLGYISAFVYVDSIINSFNYILDDDRSANKIEELEKQCHWAIW